MNFFERITTHGLSLSCPPASRASDSRASLLEAAEVLFATKGFESTTVKDLAERAGVNVSLVSYHFGGKEGLFRAVLEQFALSRFELAQEILRDPQSEEDVRVRLTLMCTSILSSYAARPHLYQMVQRACEAPNTLTKEIFATHFQRAFTELERFLSTARERGILRSDFEPRISGAMFMMGFIHLTRMDAMNWNPPGQTLKDEPYRQLLVKTAVQQFLKGSLA